MISSFKGYYTTYVIINKALNSINYRIINYFIALFHGAVFMNFDIYITTII